MQCCLPFYRYPPDACRSSLASNLNSVPRLPFTSPPPGFRRYMRSGLWNFQPRFLREKHNKSVIYSWVAWIRFLCRPFVFFFFFFFTSHHPCAAFLLHCATLYSRDNLHACPFTSLPADGILNLCACLASLSGNNWVAETSWEISYFRI